MSESVHDNAHFKWVTKQSLTQMYQTLFLTSHWLGLFWYSHRYSFRRIVGCQTEKFDGFALWIACARLYLGGTLRIYIDPKQVDCGDGNQWNVVFWSLVHFSIKVF
jgi:hypothetical protein